MNRFTKQEMSSLLTSIALLIFLTIDPMGILTCKTGTCSISPVRELIGWALLYYSISEVIFFPIIKLRETLKVNTVMIFALIATVSIIEFFFLRYHYFIVINLFALIRLKSDLKTGSNKSVDLESDEDRSKE